VSEAVTRLEEKIAYLERHVAEQDKAMLELAEDLARLKREIKALGGRLPAGAPSGTEETSSTDDRPPHY
jgi:SlyX protein